MELKKEIRILGRRFEVEPRAKESLKGITVGEKLSYRFYDGTYQGTPLLFVEPKKGNPSPRTCAITGKRLTEALGLPAVFILAPGPTYERHRLADKGVVISRRAMMMVCLILRSSLSDSAEQD